MSILLLSYSVFFVNELPSHKKVRTYAKQRPIQLKRRLLTVEVDYENLFTNGMVINAYAVNLMKCLLIEQKQLLNADEKLVKYC